MHAISTIVSVNKPLYKTFEMFLDEHLMGQWVSGFQKIELIRGEPKKQHSKYIMTLVHDNRPVAVTQELVEIIDNQFLYFRMEHPDIITYSEINFHSVSVDVTNIHCISKIHGKGFKTKIMMPVVKTILESRQQRDYNLFRSLVEQL